LRSRRWTFGDRRRPDLAHRFLNAYLEITGDYDGLSVLRFYLVYRAMVRAKISRLRAHQLELAMRRPLRWPNIEAT
jgi:aminoglycoside phosphotransferase family enzyme